MHDIFGDAAQPSRGECSICRRPDYDRAGHWAVAFPAGGAADNRGSTASRTMGRVERGLLPAVVRDL